MIPIEPKTLFHRRATNENHAKTARGKAISSSSGNLTTGCLPCEPANHRHESGLVNGSILKDPGNQCPLGNPAQTIRYGPTITG